MMMKKTAFYLGMAVLLCSAKGFAQGGVFRPPEHHAGGASARVKGAEIDLLNVRSTSPRV